MSAQRYIILTFLAIRQNWLLTLEVCHSGDHQYLNCNPDGAGRYIVHGTLIFPGLPVADRGIGGPSFFLFLTFKQ